MKDRTPQILSLLTNEHKMEVSSLAERLGVSQVTVRKDLDRLERLGIVKRVHGYAILSNTNDIHSRIAYHYEEKRNIAQRAAEMIHDGETLMIESGSCCSLLADILIKTKRNLTILTNSPFIAGSVQGKSDFRIVLFGGTYHPDSQVLVGPLVRQCAENFWVKLFFIGANGYFPRTGFTSQNQMRAQSVRDMARQAEKVVVLAESEKFKTHGTVPINLRDQVKMVITDNQVPGEIVDHLKGHGIEVQIV